MQKFGLLIVALFALIISSTNVSAGFLKAEGTEIVDSTGTPILLRGYGLGGWLVPEGYMLNFPGFGSPTAIRNTIESLIGEENTAQFYAAYEANYVNRNDVDMIAQWGFNSIRMPFHYKLLYDVDTGTYLESGFAVIDSMVSWCKANDLYLILDMHCAPGGQNTGPISDSDGIEARLWTEPANQVLAIDVWKHIAQRYVNEKTIGGYDLINEPVLPNNYSLTDFRNFYVELTDTIRAYDTNHIVFIEGNWYATNFDGLTPPWDPNMVYSFHKYWSETDLGSIQGYLAMRAQHNVPLWMGESGENSNGWYYEAVQLFEENNVGWCWWAHKKFDTINSPYSAYKPDGYELLLDYWNGQAPQPTVSFAVNAMMEMAEALKLENCLYRPDIIKALSDPTFGTTPEPYLNHTIPGNIYAVNYDVGHQGIAYFDSEYKHTGNGSWNNGWVYRNDGVDIEASQDNQSNGYNVGWINSGERIHYTVDIQSSGLYEIRFRTASLNGGGKLNLLVDDVIVRTGIDVPSTSGWQNWTTVTVYDIPLPAGIHKFSILAAPGGFNFSNMTFFLSAVGIDEETGPIQKFELSQNYPNPFNPSTTIQYQIPKRSDVVLTVHNVLGEVVAELVNTPQNPGSYQVDWDASDYASGVYYYRITAGDFSETKKMLLIQ